MQNLFLFGADARARRPSHSLLLGTPFYFGDYNTCDSALRSPLSWQAEQNGIISELRMMPFADPLV
jgi:hypothetical protein